MRSPTGRGPWTRAVFWDPSWVHAHVNPGGAATGILGGKVTAPDPVGEARRAFGLPAATRAVEGLPRRPFRMTSVTRAEMPQILTAISAISPPPGAGAIMDPMMIREAFGLESGRLSEVAASLDDAAFARPTRCDPWTVAGVAIPRDE